MNDNYAIVDTETTGLDSPVKAVEVGWIRINKHMEVLEEFVSKINPERSIHEGAQAIHGISLESVADAPKIQDVVHLLPQPFCFIAYNAKFDIRVLSPYISYHSEICALALARRWIKGMPNYKLATLKEHLRLTQQVSHSALGDCRNTLEVLKLCAEASGRDLEGLRELESQPKMLPFMIFGMHRGKPFSEIPRPYRQWLAAQDDLHPDLKYTLDRLKLI